MRRLMAVAFLVLASSATLSAQDTGATARRFGLTFPNIGVIWNITNSVAVLPDISLGHGWSSFNSTSISDNDNSNDSVGVNIGLRFYLQSWKGMRFYLTPRYGYAWQGSERSYTYLDINGQTVEQRMENHTNSHAVSGAWGIEYPISDRLCLFADIGARYSRSSLNDNAYPTISAITIQKTNSISTVGTWGLIVYLK